MDSTLVVAQQQASGEYIHIVDHFICSTSDEVSS